MDFSNDFWEYLALFICKALLFKLSSILTFYGLFGNLFKFDGLLLNFKDWLKILICLEWRVQFWLFSELFTDKISRLKWFGVSVTPYSSPNLGEWWFVLSTFWTYDLIVIFTKVLPLIFSDILVLFLVFLRPSTWKDSAFGEITGSTLF